MDEVSATRRKREVNRDDYARLLARLHPESDRAWAMLDELRRKLVVFFEYQVPWDAETLADEALDRIAKKTGSYTIANVAEFAFGIARNLRRETLRRAEIEARVNFTSQQRQVEESDSAIARIDMERKLRRFADCLQRLTPEERNLLLHYYPQHTEALEQKRQVLAQTLKTTPGALRTRMARLRCKLEKLFLGESPPEANSGNGY